MNLPTLSLRNAMRNKTRTFLTVMGVVVAVLAFGFLRTVISAYYIGIAASSNDRLVTRDKVAITERLPVSYGAKIARIPGVTKVAAADWFGGVYLEEKNFFARFAVDSEPFLDLYPEYIVSPEQRQAYLADRAGCMVGEKLAAKYGFKIGDKVTLKGDIYAGDWQFTVRAIYKGRDKPTDVTQMFFHEKYLDDNAEPWMKSQAGFYYIGIADPTKGAAISRAIDEEFKGSPFETLTESEKAFQMSFISMSTAIIDALQIVSGFVLVIVALILGNTIAMSVRDRAAEVAILKTLGFRGGHLALLITMESVIVGALGGLVGIGVSIPLVNAFGKIMESEVGTLFPVFELEKPTMLAMMGLSVLIGFLAALIPALRVAQLGVSSAFRRLA